MKNVGAVVQGCRLVVPPTINGSLALSFRSLPVWIDGLMLIVHQQQIDGYQQYRSTHDTASEKEGNSTMIVM